MFPIFLIVACMMPILYLYVVPYLTDGKVKYSTNRILWFLFFGVFIASLYFPIFWISAVLFGEGILGYCYELLPRNLFSFPPELSKFLLAIYFSLISHLSFFVTTVFISKVSPSTLSSEGL